MAGEYDAMAAAAGLSPEERKKVESLSKALATHKRLLSLPATVATDAASRLPVEQQKDLRKNFGEESPEEKPNRGWLGTAWHYTGYQAFKGLTAVSDFMTRIPRAAQIAVEEDRNIVDAWNESGKDGEKKFNDNRIAKARQKYGNAAVNVAMRISSGETPEEIMATATPEEAYYLKIADKNIQQVDGINDPRTLDAARDLFDDTISAVNAAKYSPGRWVANIVDAVTPGDFYENGFFYKLTSGAVDALYRFRTDPFLVAGKVKRANDLRKYSLDVLLGDAKKAGTKLDDYFNLETTQAFWNRYGDELKKFRDANKAGNKEAAAEARRQMRVLAPEFGPAVVKMFDKSDVVDAQTAKGFFLNTKDVFTTFTGAVGRNRVIMPRLDMARKARITTLTATNRVFSFDKVGPKLVDDAFFGAPATDDGILKLVTDEDSTKIVDMLKDGPRGKFARFSTAKIIANIDAAKRKLSPIPMFRNESFDLMGNDAYDKIYRTAILVFPTREARLIAETFDGLDSVGKRYDLWLGLWKQIADFRGVNTDVTGNTVTRVLSSRGKTKFSLNATDEFADKPLLPSEMNTVVTAPTVSDLDSLTAKSTLYKLTLGLGNSKAGEAVTSAWSFLTLAGPRYAIRNAGEDLMINLAIGKSPWGLVKERMISTRINTAVKPLQGVSGLEKWANNPLGIALRIANKKESAKYLAEYEELAEQIVKDKDALFSLKEELTITKSPTKRTQLQNQIDELETKMEGGLVEQTRKVLARALTEGRVNRLLNKMGLNPLTKEEVDLLSDQVVFGDIENLFSTVSEGGFNFASGADYIESQMDLVKATGARMGELRLDLGSARNKYAAAAGVRGFRGIGVTTENEASLVAYLLRVSFYANDELGAVAIANLADDVTGDAAGVQKVFDWLNTDKGQKLLKEARIASDELIDQREYARLVYERAKAIFTKRVDGKLNMELLDKVRRLDAQTGEYKVTGNISLDDLPTGPNADEFLPNAVVGPELVPIADAGNQTASLMKNGWVWLGLSNARFSRQPLALYEIVDIRKQMRSSGFEEAFIANFTKGIDPSDAKALNAATRNAKKELAKLVEERAINNVLSYVDNPLVRTQVAFSTRNFARFYRAQEDFYRRLYRLVRYNPEAIQRLALTFDGVAHSGWIQEDDRGELYFVYPHFTPAYKAIQGVMTALGVEQDFKVPFPVQFGGAVKMLTPSLNPDSILPSFAGPAAALPISLLENLVNVFQPGMGDNITRMTLGKYAVDSDIVSRLLPAHLNRAIAAMDQNERNSQYASAYRKAVTYLEASGNGIPKKLDDQGNLIPPTAGELEDYRQKVRSTTLGILATRFVYGFFAPASPSTQLKSDMAEWIRDAGRANWKQAWNALRQQYGGDYEKAMQRWVELYPNLVPYTVTESDRKTVAFFGYAEESNKFVTENTALFEKYPEAAAFLIPHKGAFSFDAYKTMTDMGLLRNKRVEDYLRDVQTASDLQVYYEKRNEYENSLTTAFNDTARTIIRQQFNNWRTQFLAGRPLVGEALAGSAERAVKRINALDDLEKMLNDKDFSNVRRDTQNVLREMLNTYQNYQKQKDIYASTGGSQEILDAIKVSSLNRIKELAKFDENTQAAFDSLFGRLLDD
jgi:hypothetical protein